jgi:hypothetical protein
MEAGINADGFGTAPATVTRRIKMIQTAVHASGTNGANMDSKKSSWIYLTWVVLVLVSGLLVGIVAILCCLGFKAAGGAAFLWALACLATGALVGFLFGIPRVVQKSSKAPAANGAAGGAGSSDGDGYRQQVNTNLEQISDWLTKIIVGIGLVELKNVPKYLESVANYQQLCPGSEHCAPVAGALTVYFAVLGFFSGYLLTRLFLSRAFAEADQMWKQLKSLREFAETTRKAVTEGVGKLPLRAANLVAAAVSPSSEESDEDDPQKGKWGGHNELNGRRLQAKVTPAKGSDDWFSVLLEVVSADANRPLTGSVLFHLHPTFANPDRTVRVTQGVARLSLLAYGAFTVGAEADNGETKLELDLSTLEDAPSTFRQR